MTQKWLSEFPDPNVFYNDIQALFNVAGVSQNLTATGIPFPNLDFLMGLSNIALVRGNEYSKKPTQSKCDSVNPTQYGPINVETIMLMLGLISFSWLCIFGSSFHNELYEDLKSILTQMVDKLKGSTPNTIEVIGSIQSNEENDESSSSANTNSKE